MTLTPAIFGKPEIKITQHAADRDVPDCARAGQILAFSRSEALMRLAHLPLGPAAPAPIVGAQTLVPTQDQRVEDAVTQRLSAQCRPSRRFSNWKQFSAACNIVEIFADDR